MSTLVLRTTAVAGSLVVCVVAAMSTAPGKEGDRPEKSRPVEKNLPVAKQTTPTVVAKQPTVVAKEPATARQPVVTQLAAVDDQPAPKKNDKPAPKKSAGKKAAEAKTPDPTTKPTGAKSSAEVTALVKQIRGAKYTPVDTGLLASTEAATRQAVGKLDAYLADMGEEGDAWKTYLHWDQLQAELKKQKGFDTDALALIQRRLTAGYSGLELEPFRNLDAAVVAFEAQAEIANSEKPQTVVDKTLDNLADTVEAIGDGTPSAEQAAAIGRDVALLHRYGQAPGIVQTVTRRYSQPNLLVDVAESFVTTAEATTVDQVEPICDCILGTSIRGSGHTVGTVSYNFLEDPNEAQIATYFAGTNYSKTVGTNRSALICSSGRTELQGSQILLVGEDGFHSENIETNAVVHNQITGIGSTKGGMMGKIVTKIASKKAPEQKAQSEAVAARHAKRRLADKLRKETDKVIADANDQLDRRLRDPFERFGAVPRIVKLSTTEDDLRIRVLQEGPNSFAAPGSAPKQPDSGIAVRVHRSIVENSASQILAGRKFDGPRIRDLVENQFGLTMKEPDADDTPFSITFADENPIGLSFHDGIVSVTVRGKAFTSEDKVYEGMNITANYKAETDGKRAKLVRQGDFEIVPPGFVSGRDKLALSQTALKRLLQRRFEKTFKAEYVGEGLTLEGNLSKLGTLYVSKLRVDDDWAVVGLDRRSDQTAQTSTASNREAE